MVGGWVDGSMYDVTCMSSMDGWTLCVFCLPARLPHLAILSVGAKQIIMPVRMYMRAVLLLWWWLLLLLLSLLLLLFLLLRTPNMNVPPSRYRKVVARRRQTSIDKVKHRDEAHDRFIELFAQEVSE